jgi:hypothetical protein
MRIFLALLFVGFTLSSANAKSSAHHHHRYMHHHYMHVAKSHHKKHYYHVAHGYLFPVNHPPLVTVSTAAHIMITVAPAVAERFVGLIRDLVAAGYNPKNITCYAAHGHIPNSLHHTGEACDIDQSGWNRTSGFMYHAHSIIVANGLRDGCDFHSRKDCGHVDTGRSVASHTQHHRYYASAR